MLNVPLNKGIEQPGLFIVAFTIEFIGRILGSTYVEYQETLNIHSESVSILRFLDRCLQYFQS